MGVLEIVLLSVVGILALYLAARLISYGVFRSYFQAKRNNELNKKEE
jgi:hypothetical protein